MVGEDVDIIFSGVEICWRGGGGEFGELFFKS